MESRIRSIRPDNFNEEVMLEKEPLLIVCLAQDDGYARQLKVLQHIAERYENDIRVGLLAQDSMEICKKKLQIIGTPTFLLMKEGKEIGRVLGISDQETLTQMLDRYLSARLLENGVKKTE